MGNKGSPKSLWDCLGRVCGHRSRQGRRFKLQSLLELAAAAALRHFLMNFPDACRPVRYGRIE